MAKEPHLTRLERIKSLSNKAEGIFHYVGSQNILFRLINTGNVLASEVNHAVAFFTTFAQRHRMDDYESRETIDCIYRTVGKMMCIIDIIHAAAGAQIIPEPYEAIDFAYSCEYRQLLLEATRMGMKDDYKGPMQNPDVINLVKPAIAFGEEITTDPYDDKFFDDFVRQEEPRDRQIVFRCTKAELDSIKRYARIIEVKYTEEEIHHA